jgi:hypothetical protein
LKCHSYQICVEAIFLKFGRGGSRGGVQGIRTPLAAKVTIFKNCFFGVKKGARHPEAFLHDRPIVKIVDEKNSFFQLFLWFMDRI